MYRCTCGFSNHSQCIECFRWWNAQFLEVVTSYAPIANDSAYNSSLAMMAAQIVANSP